MIAERDLYSDGVSECCGARLMSESADGFGICEECKEWASLAGEEEDVSVRVGISIPSKYKYGHQLIFPDGEEVWVLAESKDELDEKVNKILKEGNESRKIV